MALWTFALGKELVCPLLSGSGVIVVHHVAQILDDAVKGDEVVAGSVDEVFADADVLKRAIEHLADGVVGEVCDGRLQFTVVLLEDGLHLPEDHLVLVLAKGNDAALIDALMAVWHDLRQVYLVDDAQALAMRARTLR